MKKKNLTRKLIMALTAATTAAITLGTSTYAWFSRNSNVWVEETDLYLDSYDGLLISLDGKSFSQDISSDDLKKKLTGKTTAEEAREAYQQLNLVGTTINQDDNSTAILRNADGDIDFVHDIVTYTENEYISTIKIYNQNVLVAKLIIKASDNQILEFVAVDADENELTVVDSNSINNEYEIRDENNNLVADIENLTLSGYVNSNLIAKSASGTNLETIVTYVNNGYKHENETSVANDNYLKFDLYFRIASDNGAAGAHPTYNLKFSDDTFYKSKELAKVVLQNKMVAKDNFEDAPEEYKNYDAGDEITFDVANAMRIGVDSSNVFTSYEITNDYDLGSSAIEGSTDSIHDKSKNAMYTYYNSLFTKYPLTSAAIDGDRFKTESTFTNTSLGQFVYDETENKYNDVKITVYAWLEGWDADYFLGASIKARTISIKLDFIYEEEV